MRNLFVSVLLVALCLLSVLLVVWILLVSVIGSIVYWSVLLAVWNLFVSYIIGGIEPIVSIVGGIDPIGQCYL